MRSAPSEGEASYDRRGGYGGPVNSMGFNDMGGKTFDQQHRPGMPSGAAKRGSAWLKKIAGL